MEIRPSGSAASRRAPADYFTGAVWQDPIVEAPAPGNVRASVVRFEPSARTAWHTHPAGQTLYILSGVGRVRSSRRADPRRPRWRRRLVSAERETLARRRSADDHGACRHDRSARRQVCRMDGKGDRPAIPGSRWLDV